MESILASNVDEAADPRRLLSMLSNVKEEVIILIDALDEADPPEQQQPNFNGTVMACGNAAVQLIAHELVKLPHNIRFIFSARPDALCGGMERTLKAAYDTMVMIQPWQVGRRDTIP